MSPLNKYELARELGIAVRSVERHQHRGCPFSHDDENRTVFDLVAVAHWARGGGDCRRPEPPTAGSTARASRRASCPDDPRSRRGCRRPRS